MNKISQELFEEARYYCNELSKHPILEKYWDELSLILKGSTARENADEYSDIDLVFFCEENIRSKIIKEYYEAGIIDRQDGVFLPLPDWIGHYNIDSYKKLLSYFESRNHEEIWEYTHVKILHDADNRFAKIVNKLSYTPEDLLMDIKGKYLDLQLALDWMRHPLKRGDELSVLMYCSRIIRLLCQVCYLLDEQSYPNDKWLFYYLDRTRLGSEKQEKILSLGKDVLRQDEAIECGLELDQYRQYVLALELIVVVAENIKMKYGEQPWLDEWYLYV